MKEIIYEKKTITYKEGASGILNTIAQVVLILGLSASAGFAIAALDGYHDYSSKNWEILAVYAISIATGSTINYALIKGLAELVLNSHKQVALKENEYLKMNQKIEWTTEKEAPIESK